MKKLSDTIAKIVFLFFIFGLLSCNSGPQPIKLGQDACTFCKMSIADKHFGAEIVTNKGKIFKFDDTHCLIGFIKSNTVKSGDIKDTWLVNFEEPNDFINAEKAFLLKSDELHSPMGGNVAAFSSEDHLKEAIKNFKGETITWDALQKEK